MLLPGISSARERREPAAPKGQDCIQLGSAQSGIDQDFKLQIQHFAQGQNSQVFFGRIKAGKFKISLEKSGL